MGIIVFLQVNVVLPLFVLMICMIFLFLHLLVHQNMEQDLVAVLIMNIGVLVIYAVKTTPATLFVRFLIQTLPDIVVGLVLNVLVVFALSVDYVLDYFFLSGFLRTIAPKKQKII